MMQVRTNPAEIEELVGDRVQDGVLVYPDGWTHDTGLDTGKDYGLEGEVSVTDWTSFWRRQVEVSAHPATHHIPHFQHNGGELIPAQPPNLSNGMRNIAVGKVSIAEHALAIHAAIGLKADWNLQAPKSRFDRGVSFPTFDHTSREMFDALEPQLVEIGDSEFTTVKEPVAFDFGDGAYCILYPDEGDHKLTIDHQVTHSKNAIGIQRVIFDITPDRFKYFCRARTPGYGPRKKVYDLLGRDWIRRLGGSFHEENVLFVDEKGYVNERPEFIDSEGINREALMHEIIDKLAILGLLDKRFVGKIVFNRTNHNKDLQIVEALQDRELLVS